MILDIYNNIKTLIADTLSSDHKELSHVFDIAQNKFQGSSKGYGLLPNSANEIAGETQANTMSQGFKIILTDSYISNNLSDAELTTKTLQMIEATETIFKELVLKKCGSPAMIQNVLNFAVESAVIAKEDKVILVEATFDVRIKISF